MKKFIIIALTIVSSLTQASETCLDVYKDAKWAQNSRASVIMDKAGPVGAVAGLPVGMAAFATGLLPGGAVALALVGAGFAVSGGAGLTILIHDTRFNRMIKLINQSYDFVQNGGEAGRLLRKLHRASGTELTLLELAQGIIKENEERTLCTGELETFRTLKNR